MRIASVVLAVGMLVPRLVSQEPTYEETRNWIIAKIGEEAGSKIVIPKIGSDVSGFEITTSYEQVSMDECRLKYTEVVFASNEVPKITTHAESIPIAKVIAVKVELPNEVAKKAALNAGLTASWSATVVISTPINLITSKETTKSGDKVLSQEEPVTKNEESIQFKNQETANRMAKALNHAVSLCANSKEKEPF